MRPHQLGARTRRWPSCRRASAPAALGSAGIGRARVGRREQLEQLGVLDAVRSTLAAGAGGPSGAGRSKYSCGPAGDARSRRAARTAACSRYGAWRTPGRSTGADVILLPIGMPDNSAAEHRLPALARHRPLRPALRPPGADAEHPAARRPGAAVPPGVLRGADLLGQPRACLLTGQWAHSNGMIGPRPPRLRARRLRPPHRPHAARRRLLVRARRRAAPVARPGRARLRPRGRHRQPRTSTRSRRPRCS